MKREARERPRSVNFGFEDDCITIPIDAILPVLSDEFEPVSARTVTLQLEVGSA